MPRQLTDAELAEAREWIADCTWADLEPDEVAELPPERVERGIARHFGGGIEEFRRTCTTH